MFSSQRRAKRPEGADQETMVPRRTPAKLKRSTVALALPVCLSDWLAISHDALSSLFRFAISSKLFVFSIAMRNWLSVNATIVDKAKQAIKKRIIRIWFLKTKYETAYAIVKKTIVSILSPNASLIPFAPRRKMQEYPRVKPWI